ncbi:YdeI/OmpD-associated family protein [Nocardia spumae]|uniref:YdeI/OmpD-associated family protein n=1 Tax=Nocardia spumae TaxID=2887190 RepID=UPI001D141C74|nr:YdeI/OmpD-associated family protein [Nocardia spumae]
MERFQARIESARGGGAYVAVPVEVVTALGGGGRIPVRATFDGVDYIGSVVSMGDGPCLGVLGAIRAELGKQRGDTVEVTVERDTAERVVAVPDDLAAALAEAGLRAAFDGLSYSRRREQVGSITSAKRPETRARRVAVTVEALAN